MGHCSQHLFRQRLGTIRQQSINTTMEYKYNDERCQHWFEWVNRLFLSKLKRIIQDKTLYNASYEMLRITLRFQWVNQWTVAPDFTIKTAIDADQVDSTLDRVMAGCRQATSQHLSHCWSRYSSFYRSFMIREWSCWPLYLGFNVLINDWSPQTSQQKLRLMLIK